MLVAAVLSLVVAGCGENITGDDPELPFALAVRVCPAFRLPSPPSFAWPEEPSRGRARAILCRPYVRA